MLFRSEIFNNGNVQIGDSLFWKSSNNRLSINAGTNPNSALTVNGADGINFKGLPKTNYNYVVAYDSASGQLGYKSSTGGEGGGTPAGSNGYVQFNSSGSFGADSLLFWDNTNKRLGIGTKTPDNKMDIVSGGEGTMNKGTYENVSFEKNSDNKVGIYYAGDYAQGGASLVLGSTKATNSDGYYPGFEIQNANDSTGSYNSLITYNYLNRNNLGQLAGANVGLFNIYADGRVVLNSSCFGASNFCPNSRLIIGADITGATLETSGNAHIEQDLTVSNSAEIGTYLQTNGARFKHINYVSDGATTNYEVIPEDHIIIYSTADYNVTVTLPQFVDNGRELTIKHPNTGQSLTIDGNGNNIDGAGTQNINNAKNSASVTIVYYDGNWYVTNGEVE